MAYQTGVTPTLSGLIGEIRTFAQTLGFTEVGYGDAKYNDTSDSDIEKTFGKYLLLRASGNGSYFCFFTVEDEEDDWDSRYAYPALCMHMFHTYDSSLPPWQQPSGWATFNKNTPGYRNDTWCHCRGLQGSVFASYHLFGSATSISCVLEVKQGVACHFGFDCTEYDMIYADGWGQSSPGARQGYGTGWPFVAQDGYHLVRIDGIQRYSYSTHSTIIRAPFDGIDELYHTTLDDGGLHSGYPKGSSPAQSGYLFTCTPSAINGDAQLIPLLYEITHDEKSYLLGYVPNIRAVNLSRISDFGATVQLGADEWMLFPVKKRQTGTVADWDYSSGVYGLAYKK